MNRLRGPVSLLPWGMFAVGSLTVLAACDPPAPPTTLDGRRYVGTCVEVRNDLIGPSLNGVRGPIELGAAHGIAGVHPTDAFAIRHDEGRGGHCRHEAEGDWLLVHAAGLSDREVQRVEELVRKSRS